MKKTEDSLDTKGYATLRSAIDSSCFWQTPKAPEWVVRRTSLWITAVTIVITCQGTPTRQTYLDEPRCEHSFPVPRTINFNCNQRCGGSVLAPTLTWQNC